MKDLPNSTKIFIFLSIILTIFLGVISFGKSNYMLKNKVNTLLIEYKVDEKEYILEEFQKIIKTDKDEAIDFVSKEIEKSVVNPTKEELEIFENRVILKDINLSSFKDTFLIVTYNKVTATEKELDLLKEYLKQEDAFPVKIIYMTNPTSKTIGKGLYFEAVQGSEELEVDNIDDVDLPLGFLVNDKELIKTYKSYKDFELK